MDPSTGFLDQLRQAQGPFPGSAWHTWSGSISRIALATWLAAEFSGFWKNFVELFHMEEWRMYLTGESYAGVYIPYIAGAVRLIHN